MILHDSRFQGRIPYGEIFPILYRGKRRESFTPPLESLVCANNGNGGELQAKSIRYYIELIRMITQMLKIEGVSFIEEMEKNDNNKNNDGNENNKNNEKNYTGETNDYTDMKQVLFYAREYISVDKCLELGNAKDHNYPEIKRNFQEIVEDKENNIKIWVKAWLYIETGRRKLYREKKYREAIAMYKKAESIVEKIANIPEARYAKALIYGKTGNYNEAIKEYEEAAKEYKIQGFMMRDRRRNYALCYNNQAVDLMNWGIREYNEKKEFVLMTKKYRQAFEAYQKAIDIDYNYPINWDGQGTIFFNSALTGIGINSCMMHLCASIEEMDKLKKLVSINQLTEAQKMHYYCILLTSRQIINKKQVLLVAKYAEAFSLEKLGDKKLAARKYKKIIEQYPDFIWTYCNLGFLLYLDGKHEEAYNSFNIALIKSRGGNWFVRERVTEISG